MRSFTRLIVGGLLVGYDILEQRIQEWEEKVSDNDAAAGNQPEINIQNNQNAGNHDVFKYMLVGAAFEIQEHLDSGFKTANRAASFIGRLSGYVWQPFYGSRLLAPVRSRFEAFVERGEEEVNAWIETGRAEVPASRNLANTALYTTVDDWVNYFTHNPEVKELVQTQSIGLAEEVVEEVRERTVSADNFVESIARAVLRRPPRSELPPPSEELRKRAKPLHTNGKTPSK